MQSVGIIKIKVDPQIIDQDKLKQYNYFNIYEDGWLRLGFIYIRELNDFYSKYNHIALGTPFPSSNSEVLKVAPPTIFFKNLTQSKANFINKDVDDMFDYSSFTVEYYGNSKAFKHQDVHLTQTYIRNICICVSYTHKDILADTYLKDNHLTTCGKLTYNVMKVFPSKIDDVKQRFLQRDYVFSKIIYPSDIGPCIEDNIDVGILTGLDEDFYLKYDMKLMSARTSQAIIIVMRRGLYGMEVFLNLKYSIDNAEIDYNHILFLVLIAILQVHIEGIIHGDTHINNFVFMKDEYIGLPYDVPTVNKFDESKKNLYIIDFGKSFYFGEDAFGLRLYEESLPDIYKKYKKDIFDRYEHDADEFIISCTVADILVAVRSLFGLYDDLRNKHKHKNENFEIAYNHIVEMKDFIEEKLKQYFKFPGTSILELFMEGKLFDMKGGVDFDNPEIPSTVDPEMATAAFQKQRAPDLIYGNKLCLPAYRLLKTFYADRLKKN